MYSSVPSSNFFRCRKAGSPPLYGNFPMSNPQDEVNTVVVIQAEAKKKELHILGLSAVSRRLGVRVADCQVSVADLQP